MHVGKRDLEETRNLGQIFGNQGMLCGDHSAVLFTNRWRPTRPAIASHWRIIIIVAQSLQSYPSQAKNAQ